MSRVKESDQPIHRIRYESQELVTRGKSWPCRAIQSKSSLSLIALQGYLIGPCVTLSHSEARADLSGEDERGTITHMRRIFQVQQHNETAIGYLDLAQHGSVEY
jgi:hypothetical protein